MPIELPPRNRALKNLRLYSGMKQKYLANKLGVSAAHLCGIEKGSKNPSIELLEKYSEVFDIPLSSLLYFEEQITNSDSDKKRPISNKVMRLLEWIEEVTHEPEHLKR